MSKLWIVHRNPRRLEALTRLSGLAAPDLVCGGPTGDEFLGAPAPAAILIGVEGDFELELEFLHRHRRLLERSKRRLLSVPEDVEEARRLFGASAEEILDSLPSERVLRALVLSAVAHRNAESLAERRDRERIAHRFASWFGDLEVPGLLRALDPALASLSLLVRGVPGSGRTLIARYVELFRVHGAPGPTMRVHAQELVDIHDLVSRLQTRTDADLPSVRTIWIDEIDSLGVSAQRTLAEWIRHDATPSGAIASGLRWVATAGPSRLSESLHPDLERAFSPLCLHVPSLADHPGTLAPFAEQIASNWTAIVGGIPRRIGSSAIIALEAHSWSGDRSAVEAVLRAALAASSQDPIEEVDLNPSQASFGAYASDDEGTVSEAEKPIEQAVFASLDDATSTAAHEFSAENEAPTESFDDFERAFLEDLPAAEPNPTPDPLATHIAAGRDADAGLSEESLRIADGEGRETGGAEPETPSRNADAKWRRLARSLTHEIRNPLVSIRTFAELLPENFADESFRERFTELVGRDVAHIDEVVSRLASAAEWKTNMAGPVDVSEMIESLLDERRDRIARGRLLVLRELERDAPIAWADAHGLEIALSGLLDRALASLPERGDLFVATRRIEHTADGAPRLRVLLRHHNPELAAFDESGLEELASTANVLEYVLAETIVESSGGSLTIESTDAWETLILVDLRTPA